MGHGSHDLFLPNEYGQGVGAVNTYIKNKGRSQFNNLTYCLKETKKGGQTKTKARRK